jgi:L,D-transpeptidase ErfK/SrfK
MLYKSVTRSVIGGILAAFVAWSAPALARVWKETEFANRPLIDYPLPSGQASVIGSLTTYKIEQGDTLLDVGRWYGLSGKEISDANGHMDWWAPPVGRQVILPTEHILPEGPREGIVMNIPEMRIYYYYPALVGMRRRAGKHTIAMRRGSGPRVVYSFPVGLGRFDWKTPIATWHITARIKDPTWVVPKDIYEEHLERDGEAEHVVYGGDPDNPLGHYKLDLSLPEYGIHGTNVPWGVGMNVSHGCIRLYPEDIERLFMKTPVGTPGRFVYQPVKFGWRGDALYVEVHDDLYSMYPGLWNHALNEVKRLHLEDDVDLQKLQTAVEARSGIPTYVMTGPEPGTGLETASLSPPPPSVSTPAPGPIVAASSPAEASHPLPLLTHITASTTGAPVEPVVEAPAASDGSAPAAKSESPGDDWVPVNSEGATDSSIE